MSNLKNTTQVAVEKTAEQVPGKKLSKHDEVAIKAAKTNTKNDGSHIAQQRENLIVNAKEKKSQETK